ncbi:MAG: substrate-binding domain-containing protein [Lachnospiraceae bacterium]|nr:substrate-binding domain-containing protein [Lachnospiraceae bacterium]
MKKFFALFLIFALCLPLFACQNPQSSESLETTPSESAETTPAETSAPAPTETEAPTTEAPSETEEPEVKVSIGWHNNTKDLSDDRKEAVEHYVRLLSTQIDVSTCTELSDEVKENWDPKEVRNAAFDAQRLFWEDDEQFILYGTRNIITTYWDNWERKHFIQFVKTEDGWTVRKDVFSDNDFRDRTKERNALILEAFDAQRKNAPLTETVLEEARSAAIAQNVKILGSKLTASAEQDLYRDHLEAVYDPEWEAEVLPGLLTLSADSPLDKPMILMWVRYTGANEGLDDASIRKLYIYDSYGKAVLLRNDGKEWQASIMGSPNYLEPDPPKSTLDPNTGKKAVRITRPEGCAPLTDEIRQVLGWYADLLVNEWDPSEIDGISEEVRANWGWWYDTAPTFTVNSVLWSSEDLLVVYGGVYKAAEVDRGRDHLIRFMKKDGQWIADRDVFGGGMLLYDLIPDEAGEILRGLFYRERAIRPFTDEDLKAIEAFIIDQVMTHVSERQNMNEYELGIYREGLSVKYDPDWESTYLYDLFWSYDYMVPRALVYLENRNESDYLHCYSAFYDAEKGWQAYLLNNIYDPPAPEPISFTDDTYPVVKWSVSTGRLAATIEYEYTGKSEADYTLTNAYYCCQDLVRGKCDVLLSGEPTSDFYTDAAYNDVSLQLDQIGSDPFVFFVSADNPVKSLTVQEIRGIYSGQITNWKEVGGRDAEIVAFQQPTNSVSQIGMKMLVMQDETMMDPVTGFIMTVYGDSAFRDVIMRFDESENALGYAYGSYANALYLNENVKVLAVDGVLPEAEAVRSEEYPLIGGIYAITRKGDVSENTQKLVKGLLSPSGQKCVLQEGFVPVLDVGEYVPAEQAKSDEPVLSLTDTYATNPVRVMTKTDTYEGVDYQYGVLLGLSDSAVTEKINQFLHDDALACLKKAMEMVPGGSPSTPNCFVLAEFNSGNLLSVRTRIYYYKNPGNAYTSTVGTNVRLDSGERLTLHDLFRDDAGGKDIFNEGFYRDILQKKITGTPKHYSYQNVEDRLLLYTRRYDEGDAFDFYFTPRCACLLGEGRTEASQPLCIWFCECPGATAVYGKFADLKVVYDGTYESCAGIPVLTDRDDPLRNTVEKTAGYFLDVALYENSNQLEGDSVLTEACREAMMKAYDEYIQELRVRLEKKASEGVYVFYNPTVTIETFDDGKDYFLAFSADYIEFESREELEATCEKCLETIRDTSWEQAYGRNHYIVGALSFTPEMPGGNAKHAGVNIAFDEQGNVVGKEGHLFREDAPYESKP